jgi:hypothetical protein
VYRTNSAGGLVAFTSSNVFFASAVDLASAVVLTSIINESGTNTIAKQNQPLWQAIGMAADPKDMLDICLTVVTTDFTTAAAAASLRVRYVVGG